MTPAPIKTQTPRRLAPPSTSVAVVTNPALDQIESELARQNRQLEAVASLASRFADVPFAVPPELLEEIEIACTPGPASRGTLLTLARC
jgi:hypothetical protein